jgi:hypothetical protein
MPTFAPEILQYISEFAYEKKAVNFIVNSYWDDNVFGEIVKKMEMFGNIKFQKLSQPGEYYASIKDTEEVILAPLTDSNEELVSLISRQQNYVQLVSQIILPMLNIRSPSIERREFKKIKVRRPKFEKRSREKIHQEMDSIMDFKPKKKVSGGNSVLAFVSYAIKDNNFFRIGELVENLKFYDKIENVLYCEKDTRDNFVKYMNKYVGECDVMILFCSPNALNSPFVEEEWMAALAMKKPIIPVFTKIEHIPPLLKARVGIQFDNFDFQKTLNELHSLILKKTQDK